MYNLFFLLMHVSEPFAAKYIYIDERGRRVRRGMTMLSQRRETREELATRLLDFFIGVLDGLGSLTVTRHSGSSRWQNINLPLKIHCFMPLKGTTYALNISFFRVCGIKIYLLTFSLSFQQHKKWYIVVAKHGKSCPKGVQGGAWLTYTRLTNYYQKIYEL